MRTRSQGTQEGILGVSLHEDAAADSTKSWDQPPHIKVDPATDDLTNTKPTSRLGKTAFLVNNRFQEAKSNFTAGGSSESTFASIPTVHDSGVMLHAEWQSEQGKIRFADLEAQEPTLSVTLSSSKGKKKQRKKRKSKGNSATLSGNAIHVKTVSDALCQAFDSSAMTEELYLPLDRLHEILSPGIIHELLRQNFEQLEGDRISQLVGQVLGSPPSQSPGFRRIFAILVLLHELDKLLDFIDNNMDDTALPFSFFPVSRKTSMKELVSSRSANFEPPSCWGPTSSMRFLMYQKVVHIPFFKFPGPEIYFYELQPGSILPFSSDDQVVSGGYGSVRKVGIHNAHHDYCDDSKKGETPSFAVKRLHAPDEQEFREEVNVFERLRSRNKGIMPSHLIPLQLTYKRGIDFYLVFPWANGNLKEFWKAERRDPRNKEHVCWFLAQCLGIAIGLGNIHHLGTMSMERKLKAMTAIKPEDANGFAKAVLAKAVLAPTADRQEWGRHGDIKPENILWFSSFANEGGRPLRDHMVISDFGLTSFNSANSRSGVLQEQIRGFSGTYRPPDLHLDRPISQRYDVWSLGCVLLEFTSWFLLGYEKGIDNFIEERINDELEIDLQREDKFFGFPKRTRRTKKKREAVLKDSVVAWIKKLHNNCSAPIHMLLDLIQYAMLVPDSQKRLDCNQVREDIRSLWTKSSEKRGDATKVTPWDSNPLDFASRHQRQPKAGRS